MSLETVVLDELRDEGWLIYWGVDDIPDDVIFSQYDERYGIREVSDFEVGKLIDELESRGFEVIEPDGNSFQIRCEEIYAKRLAGHDITNDLEELLLEGAGRVI